MVCIALFACGCKKQEESSTEKPIFDGGYEIVTEIDSPKIELLSGSWGESVPNAVINTPYKLFEAKAQDAFGVELKVNVLVWRFYFSETASIIDYDGEFIPTAYGKYTVEYTAIDKIGNKSVLTYDFECKEKEPLSATLLSTETEGVVGESVTIADITYKNNVGKVNCKKYAVSVESGAKTEIVDGSFVPIYTGEYKIVYEYSDYNEKSSISYGVVVKENDKPMIYGDAVLYKYYIKGYEYKLPELNCVSYINGEPAKISPNVYVIYEGEVPELIDSNAFVPKKEGDFRVKYVATLNGKTEERTYKSKAVDVGLEGVVEIDNYFQSNSFYEVSALDYGVKFASKDEICKIDFINPLLSKMLNTTFTFNKTNNFDKFNIYLEDVIDRNIRLKLSLEKATNDQVLLRINDGESLYKTIISLNGEDSYSLTYDEINKTIVVGGSAVVEIKKDFDGRVFNGFTSGSCYISYEMCGVKSNSSFNIETIDNQTFYKDCDIAAPYVYYTRYSDGYKNIGDVIEIQPVYVGGVLLPGYDVEFNVKSPDGSYAIDVNGLTLESGKTDCSKINAFCVTQIGKYNVNIKVSNISKDAYYSFVVVVQDNQAPVIELSGENKQVYKLGEEFEALKATVTDNISQENKLAIYVYAPNGVLYQYVEGEKFILDKIGEYTVYYHAMDESENVSLISYSFKVEK